jgi:hypothetical protein
MVISTTRVETRMMIDESYPDANWDNGNGSARKDCFNRKKQLKSEGWTVKVSRNTFRHIQKNPMFIYELHAEKIIEPTE